MTRLQCRLDLPANYRAKDVLALHRRDPAALAEAVTENTLRKGLIWQGRPACFTITFANDFALAGLAVDGAFAAHDKLADLQILVMRMLGLQQHIGEFERRFADHAQLGTLLAAQSGLRVPQAASTFEALTWAITGQQISLHAAI